MRITHNQRGIEPTCNTHRARPSVDNSSKAKTYHVFLLRLEMPTHPRKQTSRNHTVKIMSLTFSPSWTEKNSMVQSDVQVVLVTPTLISQDELLQLGEGPLHRWCPGQHFVFWWRRRAAHHRTVYLAAQWRSRTRRVKWTACRGKC